MSILYEYLKILEKKKEQNASRAPFTPVKQKKSISVWPYLIIGLAVFACALILFFWKGLKVSLPVAISNTYDCLNDVPSLPISIFEITMTPMPL